MKNEFLAEGKALKVGVSPVDLNVAAVTGARIGMKKGDRLAIILQVGASTGAEVRVTLRQHTAQVGGTSADLAVDNPYFHKVGAATSFTKVKPTSPAALYNLDSILASNAGVVVFEVLAEDLDVNANFSHVSVDIADSTAAKLGCVLYVLEPNEKPAHLIEL
jgi:hypothetical protein